MTAPTFEILEIAKLSIHEEIDLADAQGLAARIRAEGVVEYPIWVARGSLVILNGHHRYHALRSLGATRIPAWVVDYDDPHVHLERWSPGPPITKAEVLARAREGRPFPPKTTRHRIDLDIPNRPTKLALLLPPSGG